MINKLNKNKSIPINHIEIQRSIIVAISSIILLSIITLIIRLTYYDIGEVTTNIQCMILLNVGNISRISYDTLNKIGIGYMSVILKTSIIPILCIIISNLKFIDSYRTNKLRSSVLVGISYSFLMLFLIRLDSNISHGRNNIFSNMEFNYIILFIYIFIIVFLTNIITDIVMAKENKE
ncbi:MAG: hypothetical protein RRZ84_05965 [Romboutsia sp.]